MDEMREGRFEGWLRDINPVLQRRAVLLTHDRSGAQDLVQEALTILYTRRARLNLDSNPAGYAFRVLFRLFLRSRRRSAPDFPFIDRAVITGSADLSDQVALRASVLKALELLTATERAVVVLRYLDDLPAADVASILGRTPGSVRVTAHRALAKLRAAGHLHTDDARSAASSGDTHRNPKGASHA